MVGKLFNAISALQCNEFLVILYQFCTSFCDIEGIIPEGLMLFILKLIHSHSVLQGRQLISFLVAYL